MIDKARYVLVVLAPCLFIAAAGAIEDDARPGRAEYVEMGCYQCHGSGGHASLFAAGTRRRQARAHPRISSLDTTAARRLDVVSFLRKLTVSHARSLSSSASMSKRLPLPEERARLPEHRDFEDAPSSFHRGRGQGSRAINWAIRP